MFTKFRKEFYSLFYGNWSAKILDLGNVISGESYSDTYFAVESLHKDLINQNIVVIFIGGGQDFTFSLYKSLSKKHKKVNILFIIINLFIVMDLRDFFIALTTVSTSGNSGII